MNCKFCHQECISFSDGFHRCLTCNTDYHNHAVCLYTYLKDKPYTVKLYKSGKMTISTAFQDPLLTVNSCANITPTNIKDKLQTYLTFL